MDRQQHVGSRRWFAGGDDGERPRLPFLVVAADAGAYIYWANINVSRTIGRANLDGTGPTRPSSPTAMCPTNGPCGVAVDSRHIYWGNHSRFDPGFPRGRHDRPLQPQRHRRESELHHRRPRSLRRRGRGRVHLLGGARGGGGHPGTTIGRANIDGSGVDNLFIPGAASPWASTRRRAHLLGDSGNRDDRPRQHRRQRVDQKLHPGASGPAASRSQRGPTRANGVRLPEGRPIRPAPTSTARPSYHSRRHRPGGANRRSTRSTVSTPGPNSGVSSAVKVARANLDGTGIDPTFIPAAANPMASTAFTRALRCEPSSRGWRDRRTCSSKTDAR